MDLVLKQLLNFGPVFGNHLLNVGFMNRPCQGSTQYHRYCFQTLFHDTASLDDCFTLRRVSLVSNACKTPNLAMHSGPFTIQKTLSLLHWPDVVTPSMFQESSSTLWMGRLIVAPERFLALVWGLPLYPPNLIFSLLFLYSFSSY